MNSTLKQLISIVAASSFVLITQLLTKDTFSSPLIFGISSLLISLVVSSGAVILRMFMENREVGITEQHVELDRRALALSGATLVFGP